MTLMSLMMTVFLTGCFPVDGGNFCDLAEMLATKDEALARDIVIKDRDLAKGMNRHNLLVGECS